MISAWLDLPVMGVFVGLAFFFGLTAALINWLAFASPLRARIRSFGGLVASYFTSVAILFALLSGFLTAEVVDTNRQAVRAVKLETGALSSLHALSLISSPEMQPLRTALHDYLEAVLNDEWPRMSLGSNSTKAQTALDNLLRAASDVTIATAAGQAVHTGIVDLALKVAAARSERLALRSQHTDELKWAAVLFLCLMTQIALGMEHLKRRRANVAALAIFTVAAVVVLGLIAILEFPFDGPISVSSEPLERLLETVKQ